MKKVYVTRRERFNAAHKLWNDAWTADENLNIFGKCANPNWHGHNYELFVTVKGTPSPDTGYCIDLKNLSDLLKEEVTEQLDHKNLNLDVAWLDGMMTSTEILCIRIWERIEDKIASQGCQLHSVKLFETENNSAEYFGGE